MFLNVSKIIVLSILISAFVLSGFFVFNQNDIAFGQIEEINLEELCAEMCEKDKKPKDLLDSDYQKILEQCRQYYEEQSAEIEKDISKTAQEKKTLQNEIYFLKNKINKLNNEIYQSNLMIKDLGVQIVDTGDSIDKTLLKIEDSQEKLVNILRTIYEEDQKSIIEILLSESELSGFFNNLVSLEALSNKNKELLGHIKSLKTYLDEQKCLLDTEKGELEDLVVIHSLQKQESASTKKQQEYLLSKTEIEYQKYLKEQEKIDRNADEIMARMFELVGTTEKLNFGEAYNLAKSVAPLAKIRPAFLLSIIAQESMNKGEFGGNVGQCYLKNEKTGAGVDATTGRAISKFMKATRDVQPFLIITKDLGKDPFNTLVSCPGPSGGYGGAMGPAQFIPSTWLSPKLDYEKTIKGRIEKITGKFADPWNIKDAFLGSAIFLADLGANKQTPDGEWAAALRYYSGTSVRTKYNGWGFYADKVMERTAAYVKDIEAIESK